MTRAGALILALACGLPSSPLTAQAPAGPIVHTYAPSPSTQKEAGRIRRFCRWSDTTVVRDADALLVVVRSSRSDPLSPSYDNLRWLHDDARSLLNESGAQFHVYLFLMRPDHGFRQAVHRSYDADPGLDPAGQAPPAPHASLVCPF
jgi:hypothetical protein